MSDLFNHDILAQCGHCGQDVMTLDGWPGPVAACAQCDVWTVYRTGEPPEIIDPRLRSPILDQSPSCHAAQAALTDFLEHQRRESLRLQWSGYNILLSSLQNG